MNTSDLKLSQIDLNLLVVFDVIHREGNLTRAAQVLNITQPAVSNALARLRDTFQDPLYVRSGRAMIPTPLARELAPSVQKALAILQKACESGQHFDPASSDRRFRIALNDITGAHFLPDLLKMVTNLAPGISIESIRLPRSDLRSALSVGKIDFAIDIALPPSLSLQRAQLTEDDYVCVMRTDHPLAAHKLTQKTFFAADHITVSNRETGLSYIEGEVGKIDGSMKTRLRTQNYAAAFNTVQKTDMLLAAPRALAKQETVIVKDLPFKTSSLLSFLYWHKASDQDPAHEWFRERIVELVT